MGLLDSFYFAITADSKDAVSGINKAGEAFDDLKKEGKEATETVSRDMDRMGKVTQAAGDISTRAIGSITQELKGLILPAGAAVAALGSVSLAWNRIQAFVDTANNAASLNIPVDQYDTFAKVLESVGYEADETRDLFVDLAEAIGEGATDADSQRAKTFKALGVSLKDSHGNVINATQGIEALSKAIDGLSPEKAIFQLRQLGINDPKFLTLLTKGNAELQKRVMLAQKYGIMTEEQARAARDLQNEQQKLSLTLAGIGESIARGILPYVAGFFKALNAIIDYVNEHKVAFSVFFGIPATVIATALIPAILQATLATGRLALATLAATWPWLALAAAVAAVAIAAEDVYLYFTDPTANTVTGELVKKFPELAKFLQACRDEVMNLINWFVQFKTEAAATWDEIIGYINSLNPLLDRFVDKAKSAFTGLFSWFRELGLQIGDFFRDLFAGIVNSIVDSIPEAAQKALGITKMRTGAERRADESGADVGPPAPGTASAAATASPGGADMAIPGDPVYSPSASAANRVISGASSAPINSVAGSNTVIAPRNITNSGQNVTIERMEVNTQASDPEAVNSAIVGGMQDQWKNAVAQHDDGINH